MEADASSRDLLRRFAGSTSLADRPPSHPSSSVPNVDEVELSLGLSLGGCFSPNAREKTNKLIRSSSISSFPFLDSKDENFLVAPAPLHRTCSMPVPGAEEEYRKRKELQSLKRLEAKRKRSEKRNSALKGEEGSGCAWLPGIRRPPLLPAMNGSVGSSSSADGSLQGFDIVRFGNCSEAKSSDLPNHRSSIDENSIKKLGRQGSGTSNTEKSAVEDMPCVSTRGNGPNGKRIEGFLYKYGNGEEVRIVCVCHGNFLTPAEFVRHAGGGDVEHPLRHIVVSPPSPFL